MGAMLLSFLLGTTSGTAKQSFDALVQRDAPDANRGRSFARFETRFQLAWVLGAAVPLLAGRCPSSSGYLIIGGAMAVAMVSYWIGQRRVARGTYEWDSPGRKLWRRGLRRVDSSLPAVGRVIPGDRPADATEVLAPTPPSRWGSRPAPIRPPWFRLGRRPRGSGDPVAGWMPPPGFVSKGLNDDATVFDGDLPDGAAPALAGRVRRRSRPGVRRCPRGRTRPDAGLRRRVGRTCSGAPGGSGHRRSARRRPPSTRTRSIHGRQPASPARLRREAPDPDETSRSMPSPGWRFPVKT